MESSSMAGPPAAGLWSVAHARYLCKTPIDACSARRASVASQRPRGGAGTGRAPAADDDAPRAGSGGAPPEPWPHLRIGRTDPTPPPPGRSKGAIASRPEYSRAQRCDGHECCLRRRARCDGGRGVHVRGSESLRQPDATDRPPAPACARRRRRPGSPRGHATVLAGDCACFSATAGLVLSRGHAFVAARSGGRARVPAISQHIPRGTIR